jgi:predicted Zn finger-like uncharacterized protein
MPLSATCPNCASSFKADDRYAGKTARCPKCQTPFQVPALTASHTAGVDAIALQRANRPPRPAAVVAKPSPIPESKAPPTRQQIAQQVLGGFTGPIKRPRTPVMYQLAAIVVALLMILLPLVYLGLIGLAG